MDSVEVCIEEDYGGDGPHGSEERMGYLVIAGTGALTGDRYP